MNAWIDDSPPAANADRKCRRDWWPAALLVIVAAIVLLSGWFN